MLSAKFPKVRSGAWLTTLRSSRVWTNALGLSSYSTVTL
jgi:hypothetical protein